MEINFTAIYVLWLREMKRFLRSWSRMISMIAMPLFFLIFLGFGFKGAFFPGVGYTKDYIHFLVPGVIGMTLISTSMMSGLSVLWDKEFGFLKEIMVAPVSRFSIVLGRIIGGMTTSLTQAFLILIISIKMGFTFLNPYSLLLTFVIMVLISAGFIGLGLIFASVMKDIQGFGLITQVIIMPLIFLSGAFFPLTNLPKFLRYISYLDPLTYGVEGLRKTLIGFSFLPFWLDFSILVLFSIITIFFGSYLFEKSEVKT
jgi:ABC-2 type transport system permease protein